MVKRRAASEDGPVHLLAAAGRVSRRCSEAAASWKTDGCLEATGSDDAGISATLRDGDRC